MIGEHLTLPTTRVAPLASGWSIERLLYGLALTVGVWLRLWMLGAQPLSTWEASNSWPAWLAANGLQVADAPISNSALYYGLQWLLFFTGVNSDGGARFISALAGAGIILLPWWWREFLGRRVALILAWSLAVDPWMLGFSRLADGASVALFCGLLTLVGITRVAIASAEERTLRHSAQWQRIASVAAGLLLVSGPVGWNFLPVIALMGWLLRRELADAGLWRREWLFWLGGAALVGATAWFTRLDGVALIGSGVEVWLSQLDGRNGNALLPQLTGGYDLGWPWLRLWVDAAPLLLMGIGGLIVLVLRAARRNNPVGESRFTHSTIYSSNRPWSYVVLPLCIGWLAWGSLLCLLPGRSPLALPMLGLPLLLLTAYWLDALVVHYPDGLDWRETSAVVITLLILLISGLFWLTALLANRNFDPVLAQATVVIFGLGLAILVAFAFWANRRDAAWVAASLLAVLLLVTFVRSSWKLNFADARIEPSGWQATTAHPEMRLLAEDVQTLSAHRSGDPHELPVQVQVASYVTQNDEIVAARPDPVLGWELRNMRNLTWVTSPLVAPDASPLPLVITPVREGDETAQLDLPSNYAGSLYHVESWWLPRALIPENPSSPGEGESALAQFWSSRLQPWWRWVVYRESSVTGRTRDIVLWAPIDPVAE
jgi:hypothetical protein